MKAAAWALAAGTALAAAAGAADVFVAAGDSLTFGIGDPEEKGYPRRLEVRLRRELDNPDLVVLNEGRAGDDTFALLSRFDSILAHDGEVLLLMVGTNDVEFMAAGEVPPEATAFNIEELARRASRAGYEPVHATIIPRPRYATRDSRNFFTRRVVWDVRELAADRKRRLVDPYQAFDPAQLADLAATYYAPQFDPVTGDRDSVGHLNAGGYDRLANAFGDVLLGLDTVPPVIGSFTPGLNGAVDPVVPQDQVFRVPLYEPHGASGFDTEHTRLLINGFPVGQFEGNPKRGRIEVVHRGLEGLGCLADLAIVTQDLAQPPNVLELPLAIYEIEGRKVNPGDIDFNCVVDEADITALAESFGTEKGEPGFSDRVDFVDDNRIDGLDFAVLARNFGKSSL